MVLVASHYFQNKVLRCNLHCFLSLQLYHEHTNLCTFNICFNASICHFAYFITWGLFRYFFAKQVRFLQALFFRDSNQCSYSTQLLPSVDSSTCHGDLLIQELACCPLKRYDAPTNSSIQKWSLFYSLCLMGSKHRADDF